ncbi:MAG: hypothetical protein P8130_02640 [Deltaproteobacteria bacterium]
MKTKLTWFEKTMLEVTFAEANMTAAARDYVEAGKLGERKGQNRRLDGFHLSRKMKATAGRPECN